MADKNIFVPNVDIIKSGYVKPKDPLADSKDDNGLVHVTRTKYGKECRNRALVKVMEEQKDVLKNLKNLASSYGLDKDDIKDVKDDIKDAEEEKAYKASKDISKLVDPYFAALINSDAIPTDIKDYIESGGKKKKKKKKKHKHDLEGFSIKEKDKDDDKKKKKKDKDKDDKDDKERSEVAERFKEVEKISRQNLEDVNKTIDLIDDRIKEITENADRMKSKDYIISNYISAKSSLISTKQKIATDIGANRKTIYDIEMKKDKNAGDAAKNDNDMIAKLFPGIALSGKTNDLNAFMAQDGKNKDSKKKKKSKYYDDDDEFDIEDDDELDRAEKYFKKNGDIDYNKYDDSIEMEGNFETVVLYGFKDDEWKFGAVNSDGEFIDVPKSHFPNKKSCQMKIDQEKEVAYDSNRNQSYALYVYPHLPD